MRNVATVLGWCAILFFFIIYGAEFFPRHGPPITISWIKLHFGQTGLIILNIMMVIAFLALFPYRRPTKNIWKSRGTFIAFVIALMTEMFGWPLLIFVISPILDVPMIAPKLFDAFGHTLAHIGTMVSLCGVVLIAWGWIQIHKAEGLVKTGIYHFIRHPQYTGIFLFTTGWILHWPSIFTLIIWPILIWAYVWLARQEEKMALEEFGDAYLDYSNKTKRFVPFMI